MHNLHVRAISAPKCRLAVRVLLLLVLPLLVPLFPALPLSAGMADAHALLDRAEPRVGNTVKTPRTVSLWFTQNLEGAFSDIQVLDAGGARVSTGHATVDASDRKLLSVPVKALPAGKYTVKWHVLSVDTHTTEGNFTFNVEP
jgi:methionine-rich copper-binding protein CopC